MGLGWSSNRLKPKVYYLNLNIDKIFLIAEAVPESREVTEEDIRAVMSEALVRQVLSIGIDHSRLVFDKVEFILLQRFFFRCNLYFLRKDIFLQDFYLNAISG